MTKVQKIWFGISLTAFVVTEILFSYLISFFSLIFGIKDFPYLINKIIDHQILIDKPVIIYISLIIEFISLFYLFILNKKSNNKFKKILSPLMILMIVVLIIVFIMMDTVLNIKLF